VASPLLTRHEVRIDVSDAVGMAGAEIAATVVIPATIAPKHCGGADLVLRPAVWPPFGAQPCVEGGSAARSVTSVHRLL
jgi:hypothetical protein